MDDGPPGVTSVGRVTHVLDDDPTGTQSVQNVPVVLWSRDSSKRGPLPSDPVVYHLTNTRALPPDGAGALVSRVVGQIVNTGVPTRIVLRGDSTLRGHMYEEYEAAARAAFTRPPVYLLVPAMPEAGRITVDGIHMVETGDTRKPVASTPYAADPRLGYENSHLLDWAEERSGGVLRASRGVAISLEDLRTRQADVVRDKLVALSDKGGGMVCAVDAETRDDLRTIAAGLNAAEDDGAEVLVRCAPPFAAILGNSLATSLRGVPKNEKVLIVCGSFVPLATRQLSQVSEQYPGAVVEADLGAIVREPEMEQARLAKLLDLRLAGEPVAVLATPREPPSGEVSFNHSLRIAENLAEVLRRMYRLPSVVVAKGGITSATVASVGLRAESAWVEGPAMTGVATWRIGDGDRTVRLLIVPGNVGSNDLIADVVSRVVGSR